MSTTRLMPIHVGKSRRVNSAIRDTIGYVKNPEKTDESRPITNYQCIDRIADKEFLFAKSSMSRNPAESEGLTM